MVTGSKYVEEGFESREDYLEYLSEEYQFPIETVKKLANYLGEPEDFDGLISEIEFIRSFKSNLDHHFGIDESQD